MKKTALTTLWHTRCTARIHQWGLFGICGTHRGCTPYTDWKKDSVDSEAPGTGHNYADCSFHRYVWHLSSSHPASLSSASCSDNINYMYWVLVGEANTVIKRSNKSSNTIIYTETCIKNQILSEWQIYFFYDTVCLNQGRCCAIICKSQIK